MAVRLRAATPKAAMQLFSYSITYLTLLFVRMAVDIFSTQPPWAVPSAGIRRPPLPRPHHRRAVTLLSSDSQSAIRRASAKITE